jgi:hypothetical protein
LKLLSPQQIRENKERENAFSILRARELAEAEKKNRLALNNSEIDFKQALLTNQEEWVKIEQKHHLRKLEMEKEIEKLEAERLNLLVPFDILQAETNTKLESAEALTKDLRARELRITKLDEELRDKLDETNDFREQLEKEREELSHRQEQLKAQEKLNQEQIDYATKQMEKAAFEALKVEKVRQIAFSENNAAKEQLEAFRNELKAKEDEINARDIRLKDERNVLNQAWQELKRISPKN